MANDSDSARRALYAALAALEMLEQHQSHLDLMRKEVSMTINALSEHVDVLNSLVDVDPPTVIYENSTEAEVNGNVVDGMAKLIEDDVTSSDFDAAIEPWPGVPNIPLPDAYKHRS